MEDLIKALQILLKYAPGHYAPTHCEHDELYVPCVEYSAVSEEDREELARLGFHESEHGSFSSRRFGSC